MNNHRKIHAAVVIAFCVTLTAIFLAACDLSENVSPGSDTTTVARPDRNATGIGSIVYSQRFLRHAEGETVVPAAASDLLADVLDAQGNRLGLEAGDVISLTGRVGREQADGGTLVYADGGSGIILQDLLDKIREALGLPERDGTAENNLSVTIDPAGSDNGIPDGAIVIRGRPGLVFSIGDVSIRSTDSNNRKPSPNFFNTNLNFTTFRKAADAGTILQGAQ